METLFEHLRHLYGKDNKSLSISLDAFLKDYYSEDPIHCGPNYNPNWRIGLLNEDKGYDEPWEVPAVTLLWKDNDPAKVAYTPYGYCLYYKEDQIPQYIPIPTPILRKYDKDGNPLTHWETINWKDIENDPKLPGVSGGYPTYDGYVLWEQGTSRFCGPVNLTNIRGYSPENRHYTTGLTGYINYKDPLLGYRPIGMRLTTNPLYNTYIGLKYVSPSPVPNKGSLYKRYLSIDSAKGGAWRYYTISTLDPTSYPSQVGASNNYEPFPHKNVLRAYDDNYEHISPQMRNTTLSLTIDGKPYYVKFPDGYYTFGDYLLPKWRIPTPDELNLFSDGYSEAFKGNFNSYAGIMRDLYMMYPDYVIPKFDCKNDILMAYDGTQVWGISINLLGLTHCEPITNDKDMSHLICLPVIDL